MREENIGLVIGGQMNLYVIYYDDPTEFTDGADDEEHVEEMLEAFAFQ